MTTTNANETPNPPDNKPADSVINITSTNGEVEVSSENVKLFLPSILGYEKIARGAAEALAEQIELPEARIEDLKTAVAEACMNAIEHGNSLERGINVTVVMRISEDKLEVSVADVGQDVIPQDFEPGSRPMRGWGMFFIRNLVDEMEIARLPEGGNEVRMAIYLVPPQGSKSEPAAAESTSAVTEAKPRAVQPVTDKPRAVQPVVDKPGAVQTVTDKPSAVQPVEEKNSAISPVTDRAAADVAGQATKTEQPASSSQPPSGALASDAAASENKPPAQEVASPSSDAPTPSSPES